ncbi:MAG: hypothetical protein FJ184_11015 [Gammaproteobacteria bacterium]|nr:hypothetical protein [Gammaproteobacteria bacterium]
MGVTVVHPVIVTADLERAIRFYCDVLGLHECIPLRHDRERISQLSGLSSPDAYAVVLKAPGGGEVELVQFLEPAPHVEYRHSWSDPGIRSVTFGVDDLDATLDRIRDYTGHEIRPVVQFHGENGPLNVVYVNGPDGILLTLCASVVNVLGIDGDSHG